MSPFPSNSTSQFRQRIFSRELEGLTGDAQQQDVAQGGNVAHEDGWFGPPFSPQNGTSSILGVLGGRDGQFQTLSTAALELHEAPGCLGELQRATCSTGVALWVGQVGPSFGKELVHQTQQIINLVSCNTAGISTRPALSNFTFGEPSALPFWPCCQWGPPRVPSSHWCLHSSGLLFWNGYGSHWM